jgi:uncharacterized protein YunC (DUF1805 family)
LLVSESLQIVYDGPDGRIVLADSLTYCDERIKTGDVVVGGSFIGVYPTALALRAGAKAVVGSAAGVGRDQAGIAGLRLGDRWGTPCAAVGESTARLADGFDTYENGSVSHVNQAAQALGLQPGLACAQAAQAMLMAQSGEIGRANELVNAERTVVWRGSEGRVSALASVGLAGPDNAGEVICAGSHTGLVTWRYVSSYAFAVAGVICNDAGVGKERSGIAGLEPLAEAGVAAAAVSSDSARIGEGRSTYADGIISHVNRVAERAGVRTGMAAHEAALAMLRAKGGQHG